MTDDRTGPHVEQGHKRVRAYLGGDLVADTIRPLLVWEIPYYPTYYIFSDDFSDGVLVPSDRTEPRAGGVAYFDVRTRQAEAVEAAAMYGDSPAEEIRQAVRLDWNAMDAWFEEDEQVYVHPRDPHKRIDVLRSSRHVEIEVDGVTVADSVRPVLLFETGLPVRYYLPKTDLRLDLLRPSSTTTRCPYKGVAEYYSLVIGDDTHDDIAWWYRLPAHESAGIAGLVSFYNERVDITVDGVGADRPTTQFS